MRVSLRPVKFAHANACKQDEPIAPHAGVECILTEPLMKSLFLAMALILAVASCGERKETPAPAPTPTAAAPAKAPAGDIEAGKRLAERSCKGCHGLDGKGAGPGIPHLAAQRERYLLASLNEYKDGKRHHSGLRELATKMTAADMRDIAAYYSAQPPVKETAGSDVKQSSPFELGKKLAAGCAGCHGEDGNAKASGTPTLAGQQPVYLVVAIHEYHRGDRAIGSMQSDAPAAAKRTRKPNCDRCAKDEPVIQCRVHQLHLCGDCLAQHYDFRSCAYVPSTRRATVKSAAAQAASS